MTSAGAAAAELRDVAEAFDDLAPAYDVEVGGTLGAARAKAEAAKLLRALFRPGDAVVDVGCGTGVDACRLARAGVRVVATDPSAGMLRETRRRARLSGCEDLVETRQLAASQLGALEGRYDGAYSFFGSLNLEPALDEARDALAALLRPGAPLVVGLVNRRVLWEWTLYPLLLRFDKPLRKVSGETTMRVSRARERRVAVRMYDPPAFAARFADDFELVGLQGCNVFVPPPYLDKYARKLPRLVSLLSRWEDRVQREAPWNAWGYFSILTFRRRGA
jgi:SAM-dependent methyltransferase